MASGLVATSPTARTGEGTALLELASQRVGMTLAWARGRRAGLAAALVATAASQEEGWEFAMGEHRTDR